ncbi:hypothetical protein COV81_00550 [Candidatus Peregrinibacteria bacterium CG11_big_fil_rev_8_21_14_0_20_41_10]|nr:MAG: hypothetical protein COV81_00550 [Candidatus Peregrinibacteria bacterium CG11_big_fil_rev_8_21_14_0_20_41_10]PIZ74302.1 MAG: hypothetical protein COY06_04375 [Candidatus Peregrinibacteria bacterium CG_4_10_14_0_2_um_filter_41_8]PJC38173.1 MAG: hypothetical protein CO045_01650 [Candidatus Peregrinibacteria bacterium CG_4_9_14_0_2_um_filter_41_14]
MPAFRSTISFTEQNWEKLEAGDNKSRMVNIALKFFFDSKELLKKKEEDFILNELQHYEDNNESYSFEETFN